MEEENEQHGFLPYSDSRAVKTPNQSVHRSVGRRLGCTNGSGVTLRTTIPGVKASHGDRSLFPLTRRQRSKRLSR